MAWRIWKPTARLEAALGFLAGALYSLHPGSIHGYRLFAISMFSSLNCSFKVFRVKERRAGYKHGINIFIFQKLQIGFRPPEHAGFIQLGKTLFRVDFVESLFPFLQLVREKIGNSSDPGVCIFHYRSGDIGSPVSAADNSQADCRSWLYSRKQSGVRVR